MENNKKTKKEQKSKTKIKARLKQLIQRSSGLRTEKGKDDESKQLTLRFSPTAWAKLLYFRDKSNNEVGGFGITKPDDLLYVTDFLTVRQKVTGVSVSFNDEAVADFFEQQVDLGRKPEQFARIWLHTHPGMSAEPSSIDDETFSRVFGKCQWAVMFILADGNKTYVELSFNVGPGARVLIPVEVDYSQDFGPSDSEKWNAEYTENIEVESFASCFGSRGTSFEDNLSDFALSQDFVDELEQMDPRERQYVLDELAARPDLWDQEEQEVIF